MTIEAPSEGPITVDQAIGILGAPAEPVEPAQPEAAPPEADEPESPAEPQAEEAEQPEEATAEPEEEPEDPAQPAIQAPQSWTAADKAVFAEIPRKAQEIILARETERDKATQRAVMEASEAAQGVTAIAAELNQFLPQAIQTFQGKWAGWTPEYQARLATENPAQLVALRAQFELEQGQLAQLDQSNRQANNAAFQQFVNEQLERLRTTAPDLADEKEGPSRKQQLAVFLRNEGIPADQIERLDATAISLAYDAMRYRQQQASVRAAATKPTPRTPPAPAAPPVRPAAAQPAPSRTRSVDQARTKLTQTGSVDDALALLRAKRG